MTEPSIAPQPGLVKPADSNSGQKSQFGLFSDSWLELQGYVGTALEMPITEGDFKAKYGDFGGEQQVKDCITAMQNIKASATEFGNPKTLRAKLISDPTLLATEEPPEEIYSHTVWLGQRVNSTAGRFVSGYKTVLDELVGLPSKDQVEALKAYLLDETLGPIPLSKTMSDEVGVLIKKLGKFEQKMNEYNAILQSFTRDSSNLVQMVNQAIGAASEKIKSLEKSRDDAYKAWKDFTIAAVTCSVGCALIGGLLAPFTGGVSLLIGGAAAIATGVGLGVKAAENKVKYNEFCNQIRNEEAEKQKKIRLRSDLGDFNLQIQRVGPAMADFLKNLQTVEGAWVQMNTDMREINNSITEENIGKVSFLVKAKANLAIDRWKEIGDSAKQFTVGSLVDYTSIAFGDQMPENMPQAA